jgi:hypothetical protein
MYCAFRRGIEQFRGVGLGEGEGRALPAINGPSMYLPKNAIGDNLVVFRFCKVLKDECVGAG